MHMIVHDLRTPLTVIMGNVETASALATAPKQHDLLQRAAPGEQLLTLIGNLLDISRMEEPAGAVPRAALRRGGRFSRAWRCWRRPRRWVSRSSAAFPLTCRSSMPTATWCGASSPTSSATR